MCDFRAGDRSAVRDGQGDGRYNVVEAGEPAWAGRAAADGGGERGDGKPGVGECCVGEAEAEFIPGRDGVLVEVAVIDVQAFAVIVVAVCDRGTVIGLLSRDGVG